MKALILNSGIGNRMGEITNAKPKCMIDIYKEETILSRQLKLLELSGISEVIITTGPFEHPLINYVHSLHLNIEYIFVNNPIYDITNYIYSIYLTREYLRDDIVLMHGDLVFDKEVLDRTLNCDGSCMTISTTIPIPQKDFKAVIANGYIEKIGVNLFNNAVAAQPLYKINQQNWEVWLNQIIKYCENGQVSCYAEDAYNDVSNKCKIQPCNIENLFCSEIDTQEDLLIIKNRLREDKKSN